MRVDREKPLITSSKTWTSIKYGLTKFYHSIKWLLDANRFSESGIIQIVQLSNTIHD